MKPIEWNDVVTKVISNLITVVFVGACAIVWEKANSVDDRVANGTAKIEALVEVLQEELVEVRAALCANRESDPHDHMSPIDGAPNRISEEAFMIIPKHDYLEQKIEERMPRQMEQRSLFSK